MIKTEAEKVDYAWRRIVSNINGHFEEARSIFLTRCAESAQEALAPDKKRRAALEEDNKVLREALIMHRRDLHGFSTRPCPTCRQSAQALGIKNHGQCARWELDKPELAALTLPRRRGTSEV